MNLISLYTTKATATGGRSGGTVATSDGTLKANLELPFELGGDGQKAKNSVNPEQLFACAWAASFADAVGFAAKQHSLILREITVTATVILGQYEDDGFGIATEFTISLPELEKADSEKIINEARLICPYSKAFPKAENLRITLQTRT